MSNAGNKLSMAIYGGLIKYSLWNVKIEELYGLIEKMGATRSVMAPNTYLN